MRQVTTAADRIDYWIRRRIVPYSSPWDHSAAADHWVLAVFDEAHCCLRSTEAQATHLTGRGR
jgi:hypothetical protein